MNAAIPAMLPAMSSRYASSGRNRTNVRATPSPIVAMTAATARKTQGSVTQVGGPVAWNFPAPKKRSWVWARSTWTGNSLTKMISSASATGAHGNRFTRERARRNPMPMPRKLPSRTKLEKYDR